MQALFLAADEMSKQFFLHYVLKNLTSAAKYVYNRTQSGDSLFFLKSLCFLHRARMSKPKDVPDLLFVARKFSILLKMDPL